MNLDLVLKDVEKYCYSEISYEKIKNLEYISDFDKLLEVHRENEEAYELLRKYPNEFRLKIYNYEASVKKAKIDSISLSFFFDTSILAHFTFSCGLKTLKQYQYDSKRF